MSKFFNITLYDQITFDDRVTTNQHLLNIVDTIDFTDTSAYQAPVHLYINIIDTLFFHQNLQSLGKRKTAHITDTLTLQELISFTKISSAITSIHQNITFTQSVSIATKSRISDNINFVDSVTISLNRLIPLTQNIVFKQFANGYKIASNKAKPSSTVDQILTDPIIISPRSELTFTQADGNAFGLFRLSFGNEYITQYNHVQHESMGRTLILAGNHTYSYRQSIKSLKLKFEYQKEQDLDSFMAFLNGNLGLPITLQDHEGFTYNGFINTPEAELTQTDRNNRFVEFNFEILPD